MSGEREQMLQNSLGQKVHQHDDGEVIDYMDRMAEMPG